MPSIQPQLLKDYKFDDNDYKPDELQNDAFVNKTKQNTITYTLHITFNNMKDKKL